MNLLFLSPPPNFSSTIKIKLKSHYDTITNPPYKQKQGSRQITLRWLQWDCTFSPDGIGIGLAALENWDNFIRLMILLSTDLAILVCVIHSTSEVLRVASGTTSINITWKLVKNVNNSGAKI